VVVDLDQVGGRSVLSHRCLGAPPTHPKGAAVPERSSPAGWSSLAVERLWWWSS
jgi:hypothetical protein